MRINWKKLFETWEYEALPIIYQGDCCEINKEAWEEICGLVGD